MIVYNLPDNLLLHDKNTIDEDKLQSILKEKLSTSHLGLNNKTHNTTSNNVYDIDINGNKYLMKTLAKSTLSDIDKEITNMTKINSNRVAKPYILQCKYLLKTKDTVVSIFESVDSMLLKDFINKVHKMTDIGKKEKLQRYLIFMLLKSISDLHRVNICHLQINSNNILVSINSQYNESDVYSHEYPLNIKFINFNLQFNNRKRKYINASKLDRLDPFIKDYSSKSIITLDTAKKYDIWCISLIIFKVILQHDEYLRFVKGIITTTSNNNLVITIPRKFNPVYNNLDKYVLTELNNRKTADFILNKIALDEKHD